jgi:capsular polysaccharide biosynthesis protein
LEAGLSLEFSFKSLYEHLIKRWHLMVAFGLIGALLAALGTGLAPKRYTAQAVVMVDQQVDLALPPNSPVDDVLYVSRETVRLEDLSYADDLWEEVRLRLSAGGAPLEVGSIEALQQQVSAPHYQDGAWYFTAQDADPGMAVALANAWAESFVDTLHSWVEIAQLEISLQTQLQTVAALKAGVVDECGWLDWAAASVHEIILTTLSRSEVAESDFEYAASVLSQTVASLPGLALIDLDNLSSQDLEGARQTAEDLLNLIEQRAAACQARLDSLQQQDQSLLEEMERVVGDSYGISPFLRVQLSQLASQAEIVQADLGTAALIGLVVSFALWLMADLSGFLDRLGWSDRDQD